MAQAHTVGGYSPESSSGVSSPGSDDEFEEVSSRSQRAFKSTGPRAQPSKFVLNRRRALFSPRQVRSEASTSTANYIGPQGVGKGKGSIRMIQSEMEASKKRYRARVFSMMRFFGSMHSDIPHLKFVKYMKKVVVDLNLEQWKFTSKAIELIKDVCECYLINMFEICNLFVNQAKRVTLFPRDIVLYRRVEDSLLGHHPPPKINKRKNKRPTRWMNR